MGYDPGLKNRIGTYLPLLENFAYKIQYPILTNRYVPGIRGPGLSNILWCTSVRTIQRHKQSP